MFIPAVNAQVNCPAIQQGIGGIPDSQLEAAKKLILQRLKELYPDRTYTSDQISTDDFRCVEWSDFSLGCPEDGEFYGQALTPGYIIHFSVDGHSFTVHTNSDAYCPSPILP